MTGTETRNYIRFHFSNNVTCPAHSEQADKISHKNWQQITSKRHIALSTESDTRPSSEDQSQFTQCYTANINREPCTQQTETCHLRSGDNCHNINSRTG